MAWTAEDRRTYAPAIQEMVRAGMLVRLARTMEVIDPQPKVGRQRVWSTLIMLQALWRGIWPATAARGGRLPRTFPPSTTVWSRLQRYRRLRVDDEMSCESARGMALLAALFLTGMRLERLLAA